jgi:hypothetical protein
MAAGHMSGQGLPGMTSIPGIAIWDMLPAEANCDTNIGCVLPLKSIVFIEFAHPV